VGLLLFIPVVLGLNEIYPWTNQQAVAADAVLKAKSSFLTPNWFIARGVIYFFLWSLWAGSIYHQSTKQDTERSAKQMHIASRWSAPGLFLAVAVGTLASYDWLMSLEPKWYSTIFGLVMLSGGALSFFSVVILVCLAFRRAGISRPPGLSSVARVGAGGLAGMAAETLLARRGGAARAFHCPGLQADQRIVRAQRRPAQQHGCPDRVHRLAGYGEVLPLPLAFAARLHSG